MSHEAINSWVENAKNGSASARPNTGVQVITRQNRGSVIMEVAEKIRPYLMEMFKGVRDEDGRLLQPAQVRGIALNVAQDIVKEQERTTH